MRVVDEGKGNAAFGERISQLEVIVAISSENIDFLPVKAGQNHESIQVIILNNSLAQPGKRLQQVISLCRQRLAFRVTVTNRETFHIDGAPIDLKEEINFIHNGQSQVLKKRHQLIKVTFLKTVELQSVELLALLERAP